ncbi:MAG: ABC transporter permease subunit [Treponema sp.]|jgi:NitT/TauT family transport system permease protein|nr:ABC transporter permease subunit [Treponema sp.]
MKSIVMERFKSRIVIFVWLCLIFFMWQEISFILAEVVKDKMASRTLPYLHHIISNLFTRGSLIFPHAGGTLSRALIGFLFGAGAGFLLALAMSLAGIVERMLFPYLLISQMIPILGLAPVLAGIIGDIGRTRIFIAAFITFFPVAVNTLAGFKSVEPEKLTLVYSLAADKFTVYRKLMIPAALPFLFSGLKIAAPMAITAAILVDTLGGASGLGYLITYSLYGGFPIMVFWSSVLLSAALGILSYQAIAVIEKICMPYKYGGR